MLRPGEGPPLGIAPLTTVRVGDGVHTAGVAPIRGDDGLLKAASVVNAHWKTLTMALPKLESPRCHESGSSTDRGAPGGLHARTSRQPSSLAA